MTKHETLTSMERNPTITAATYPWFLKRAGETKGCAAFVIRQANPAAASADTAKLPHEETDPNPATCPCVMPKRKSPAARPSRRSEEHTSELQSRQYLVC